MLSRTAIRSVAEAFWSKAGGREQYGRPLELDRAVIRTLPIAIHYVPGLTSQHIEAILHRLGKPIAIDGPCRSLRGCLVADVGVALILVDEQDPLDEKRLTIAHETAHYLLHYQALREAALRGLGHDLIAVLDRTRAPHSAELFSSALRNLPLGPFRHAMVRDGARQHGLVATMEAEADDLAIELLAPWRLVLALGSPDAETIAVHFGLPPAVAGRLATMATGPTTERGVTGIFGIR